MEGYEWTFLQKNVDLEIAVGRFGYVVCTSSVSNHNNEKIARARIACGDVMYRFPVVNKRAARVECILMYNM